MTCCNKTWHGIAGIILLVCFLCLLQAGKAAASPLEFAPRASLNAEAFINWTYGRMGFEQDVTGNGTLNDLRWDLGLLPYQRSFRLLAEIRPLEHHAMRLYGSAPENYRGSRILTRELRTRNGIYPPGTNIHSELSYACFGMGYDLDFLIGPQYFAGFNGDLKYLHSQIRLWAADAVGQEDVIALDELLPCIGAHFQMMLPIPGSLCARPILPGGFVRLTYGISPNYLNYVDISIGLRADLETQRGYGVGAKLAYEHETFFHQQEFLSGKVLELKKNGFTFSLVGTF